MNTFPVLSYFRRIVGAELQNVVYTNYIPLIIGTELMQKHKLWPKYRGKVLYSNKHPSLMLVAV